MFCADDKLTLWSLYLLFLFSWKYIVIITCVYSRQPPESVLLPRGWTSEVLDKLRLVQSIREGEENTLRKI